MKKYTEEEINANMKKCPRFDGCQKNLCPLDLDLYVRDIKKQDKCRFSRETKKANINGRDFLSGGRAMPTVLLNFVPESNLDSINKASQIRFNQIRQKNGE